MTTKLPRRVAEVLGAGKAKESVLLLREIAEIESRLGITFRDKQYLDQAFIHRSYLNEARRLDLDHNERIEFLGDAILEMAVTQYLYRQHEDSEEGTLTEYRGALVNTRALAKIIDELGLAPFLRMSRGEKLFFDRNSRSATIMKGNLFEAIVGAIYLDRGVGTVELFVAETVLPKLKKIIELGLHVDPKSQFQNLAQAELGLTPSYRVIEEHGPDHDKNFLMGAYLDDRLVGQGWGPNKFEGEVEAAKAALKSEFQIESP